MGRDVVVPVLEKGAPIFRGLYDNVKDLDNGTALFCNIYSAINYTLSTCNFTL